MCIQNSVTGKMADLIETAVEKCPRLSYLSENDVLAVMSNLGNPVPLLPIISKVFPAVKLVRFTEVSLCAMLEA